MLSMKSFPTNPWCRFRKKTIGIMNETGVPYKIFDISEDEELRPGLKTFSSLPTNPNFMWMGNWIEGLNGNLFRNLLMNLKNQMIYIYIYIYIYREREREQTNMKMIE